MSAADVQLDRAGPVRPGEELDIAAIDAWLRSRVEGLSGSPEITQFTGGVSNWTYRLAYPSHDLILRRPPAGTRAASSHDMQREYRVQAALAPVYPWVPEMIALCDDPAVIGCDFYVMRRIEGLIPRARMPRGAELTPEATRALCLSVIDKLIALHALKPEAVGLGDLGPGRGYVKRQIDGWTRRYAKARTWNVPRFSRVTDWLQRTMPEDVGTCLIHNDFRLDNCVLDPADPTRVLGILDWEMATLGDPLMDLGNSLAYWIQADDDPIARSTRRQPTHLPGMLSRREVVAYYCDKTGLSADNWPFYEVYGLFRLAVIAQQVYFRYHHRQTRNKAYRHFWALIHYLNWRCLRIIRRQSPR